MLRAKIFPGSLEGKMDNYKHLLSEAENIGYQYVAGTVLRIASGERSGGAPTLQ